MFKRYLASFLMSRLRPSLLRAAGQKANLASTCCFSWAFMGHLSRMPILAIICYVTCALGLENANSELLE